MVRCSLIVALGGVALAGCRPNNIAPEPAASESASTSASTSAPAAIASTAPIASASAAPSVTASATAAAEPAPTAFYLFATTDPGVLAVAPSTRGALIVAIEPFSEDPPAIAVDGDAVTPVRGLFKGVGLQEEKYRPYNHVSGLAGVYPDRLLAHVDEVGGRTGGEGYFYERVADQWRSSIGPDPGAVTFVGGKPVATALDNAIPITLKIAGIPADFPEVDLHREDACISGRDIMYPIALAGTPSGELFMYALRCAGKEEGADASAIDLWAKGARKSKTMKAPFLNGTSHVSLVARSATEAYLAGVAEAGVGFLARFDGAGWKRDERVKAPVVEMVGADDGTLWLLHEDGVTRRAPDGSLTTLALPAEMTKGSPFEHIVATSGTEAWIYGAGFVARTKKPKEVVVIAASALAPKAATADCTTLFVQLYAVTRMTPPKFDFPKTREAMKGHKELEGVRFVVTKDDRFGAIVRTLDEGKQVMKLAQAGVRGARPQALCMKAEEAREVKFDLATGAVR